MAKFEIVTPEEIRNDPKALKFLEIGASDFGGVLSVENILNNFSENIGLLIIVKSQERTIGSIYLTLTQQDIGKVMTSVLLGGENFTQWKDELRQFYYETARKNGCDKFSLLGRRGFKKYFPELKEIATLFEVSLI